MEKIIKKTNGHKTTAVSVLMVLFQMITIAHPDLIGTKTENIIELAISSGMVSTIAHKVWRNKKQIKEFFLNLFRK